jgi:hypothetical protein
MRFAELSRAVRLKTGKYALTCEPETARAIGAFERSHCYGVWVLGRNADHVIDRGDPEKSDFNPQAFFGPHMVISSVPPDRWWRCLTIEAMLDNKPGTMAELLDVLFENDINVLVTEANYVGYSHSHFTAIAELSGRHLESMSDIESRLSAISSEQPLASSQRDKLYRDLGREMLLRLVGLSDAINHAMNPATARRVRTSTRVRSRGTDPFLLTPHDLDDIAYQILHSRDNWSNSPLFSKDDRKIRTALIRETNEHQQLTGRAMHAQRALGWDPSIKRMIRYAVERTWMQHWTEPVKLRMIMPLTHASVWRLSRLPPIKLVFGTRDLADAKQLPGRFGDGVTISAKLRPRGWFAFEEGNPIDDLNNILTQIGDKPDSAASQSRSRSSRTRAKQTKSIESNAKDYSWSDRMLLSFNPDTKTGRIRFLRRAICQDWMVRFRIRYDEPVIESETRKNAKPDLRGLYAQIAQFCDSNGLNIEWFRDHDIVSSVSTSASGTVERRRGGYIECLALSSSRLNNEKRTNLRNALNSRLFDFYINRFGKDVPSKIITVNASDAM